MFVIYQSNRFNVSLEDYWRLDSKENERMIPPFHQVCFQCKEKAAQWLIRGYIYIYILLIITQSFWSLLFSRSQFIPTQHKHSHKQCVSKKKYKSWLKKSGPTSTFNNLTTQLILLQGLMGNGVCRSLNMMLKSGGSWLQRVISYRDKSIKLGVMRNWLFKNASLFLSHNNSTL